MAHALKLPTHVNTDGGPHRLSERAENDIFATEGAHEHTSGDVKPGPPASRRRWRCSRPRPSRMAARPQLPGTPRTEPRRCHIVVHLTTTLSHRRGYASSWYQYGCETMK